MSVQSCDTRVIFKLSFNNAYTGDLLLLSLQHKFSMSDTVKLFTPVTYPLSSKLTLPEMLNMMCFHPDTKCENEIYCSKK